MSETLELIWHPDGAAFAFLRGDDGSFSDELELGEPAELLVLDTELKARRLTPAELIHWRPERELGDSARVLFGIVELAQRAVGEGLVHPQLTQGGGRWYAFWGATLDTSIEEAMAGLAAALPPVSADYFHGARVATVGDVYPRLVDQIARERLIEAGV